MRQPTQFEGADILDPVPSYGGPPMPPISTINEFLQASGGIGGDGGKARGNMTRGPAALRQVLPVPVLLLKTFYARAAKT